MKLSKREAILLTILLIIGLFFIEYRLILTPGIRNIQELSKKLDDLDFQYMTINNNLALAKVNEKKRDDNLAAISKLAGPFLDGVTPDSLLVFTHEMLLKHGFTPFNYTPSKVTTKFLQPEPAAVVKINYRLKEISEEYAKLNTPSSTSDGKDKSGTEKVSGVNDMMELYTIQINATGNYNQIRAMLDDYKSLGKTVIVSNLALNPSGVGMLSVQLTINYYGIEKLIHSDDAMNQWARKTPSVSTLDPFTIIPPNPIISPKPTPTPAK